MRLTRAGWAVLAVGIATLVVARTVQVAQLWIIGTSLVTAVAVAMAVVACRPARVTVRRTIEPAALHVGVAAHMVLELHGAHRRTPSTVLTLDARRFRIPPLTADCHHRVALDVATDRRGVRPLTPVTIRRADPLDLVHHVATVCPPQEMVVAPRTTALDMAQLGVGTVGAMLIQRARQFGVGDFEGVRHYVEGDDLRLVHWKASARSTDLLVKQFSLEGARRCTVVLDTTSPQRDDEFELAVSMATSLVLAASAADLSVRLATTGGLDLAPGTRLDAVIRALALTTPDGRCSLPRRDPAEGLGLVVCVTPDLTSDLWRQREHFSEPLMVTLAVTQRGGRGTGVVNATTLEQFAVQWNGLMGAPGRSA